MDCVFVPAKDADGVAADAQGRAGDETVVNAPSDFSVSSMSPEGVRVTKGGQPCAYVASWPSAFEI